MNIKTILMLTSALCCCWSITFAQESDTRRSSVEQFVKIVRAHGGRVNTIDQTAGKPAITKVEFYNQRKVTDRVVAKLIEIANQSDDIAIRHFDVSDTSITNECCKLFQNLEGLDAIDLKDTKVTDAGIKELAAIKSLGFVVVAGTEVTDQGVRHLLSLPKLRYLNVNGTFVSDQLISRFKSTHPDMTIESFRRLRGKPAGKPSTTQERKQKPPSQQTDASSTESNKDANIAAIRKGLRLKLLTNRRRVDDGLKLDLVFTNLTNQPIQFRPPETVYDNSLGSFEKYVQRDTQFSTEPIIATYSFGTIAGITSSQPPVIKLKPGDSFSAQIAPSYNSKKWTLGKLIFIRHGSYFLRAKLSVFINDHPVRLVSNEQLIQFGDDSALAAAPAGIVQHVDRDKTRIRLNVGSGDGVKLGDQFEQTFSKKKNWRFRVVELTADSALAKAVNKIECDADSESTFPGLGEQLSFVQ